MRLDPTGSETPWQCGQDSRSRPVFTFGSGSWSLIQEISHKADPDPHHSTLPVLRVGEWAGAGQKLTLRLHPQNPGFGSPAYGFLTSVQGMWLMLAATSPRTAWYLADSARWWLKCRMLLRNSACSSGSPTTLQSFCRWYRVARAWTINQLYPVHSESGSGWIRNYLFRTRMQAKNKKKDN